MKRYCKSIHCDVKTIHEQDYSENGLPIWKCTNCGMESQRRLLGELIYDGNTKLTRKVFDVHNNQGFIHYLGKKVEVRLHDLGYWQVIG